MTELPEGFGFAPVRQETLSEGFGTAATVSVGSLKARCNPQQRDVVEAPASGVALAIAGAGCGKTSGVILPRTEELYTKSPGTIGVLAFNVSIKEELTEKVSNLHPSVAANTKVYTNHGLALRLVKDNLNTLGLPTTSDVEGADWKVLKFLREQRALQLRDVPQEPGYRMELHELDEPKMKALFKAEETATARGVNPADVLGDFKALKSVKPEVAVDFIRWAKSTRLKNGILMFRDLLPLAAKLPIEAYEGLNIKHVLVDEAQDLSVDQHVVIRKLYEAGQSLTLVGDVAQCIYRFSGARPDLFLGITQRYAEAGVTVFPLETNYRCDQPILDLANEVLEQFIDTPIRLKPPGPRPGSPIAVFDEPFSLIPWIQMKLEDGARGKDIAVLFRANAHILQAEIMLSLAGIPYQCRGGSFFEHRAVDDVLSYFRFLQPNAVLDKDDWDTIVGHVKFLGQKTADASWAESKGNPLALDGYPSSCRSGNQRKLWDGLMDFLGRTKRTYFDSDYNPSLVIAEVHARKTGAVWEERWADDPEKWEEALEIKAALVEWAKNFNRVSDFMTAMKELSPTDPNGVMLSTVHKAKGLEWDYVALFNLGEGTFPLAGSHVDSEEEACIMYVGVTRARKELALIKGAGEKSGPSILHEIAERQVLAQLALTS